LGHDTPFGLIRVDSGHLVGAAGHLKNALFDHVYRPFARGPFKVPSKLFQQRTAYCAALTAFA
jgi:hypothetical protein